MTVAASWTATADVAGAAEADVAILQEYFLVNGGGDEKTII